MYDHLFQPLKIRDMELKNRIIMPAMGTRMADADRRITPRLAAYHQARAEGGCGLNMVEVSSVHTPSAPAHFVSISEDYFIEGHQMLTDAIHRAGGKAGIQLWQGSIAVTMDPKARIFTVSGMNFGSRQIPAITKEEMTELVTCYGLAAERSVKAGYDCIEFHCAHNYLPHSFLSGGLNHRQDEYGGSLENRAKFPLECIRAIRSAIPPGMPLFMRIDAHDDCLCSGLTIEEVISFCQMARSAGVDVLDVSRGNIITAASVYEVPPIDIPRGFNVENASRIRKETGMLTMAVGRINAAAQAEAILSQGKADLVAMGRAQLADPEFCRKAREGRTIDIIHCIGCDQGCYDGFTDVKNRPFITCLRNPQIGHEAEHALDHVTEGKKVFIAGGGMAGLEAAKILKLRGHQPELYEKTGRLGGQFITAGRAPGKEEMKEAAISFGEQIQRMGIPVHFYTELTAQIVEREKPGAVISAVGAAPIVLELPGSGCLPLFQAQDVLEGKAVPPGKVCVIGGGLVGLEAADYLAGQGHPVTVLEMKKDAGADLGSLRRIMVMQKMKEQKVEIRTLTTVSSVEKGGLQTEGSRGRELIVCSFAVMAAGAKANDSRELVSLCARLNIPCHIIGDAKQARRALNAIEEAYETARSI